MKSQKSAKTLNKLYLILSNSVSFKEDEEF